MSLTGEVSENNLDDKNRQDETNLGRLFKKTLLEWAVESLIPGVPRIVNSKHSIPLRILWVLALLTSTSYCIFLCVQVYQNYFSWPSSTKISVIQEVPTNFPVISFCNMKLLNRSSNLTSTFIGANYNYNNRANNEADIRYLFANENLTINQRKEYCFKMEGMLIPDTGTCRFRNSLCSINDFQYFYSPTYGNCYSFNTGTLYNGSNTTISKSYTSGQGSGLDLELYVGNPSASLDTMNENYAGIVISIHNQSITPFSVGNFIKAAVNTRTDIVINRNFLKKLPSPYGDCQDDVSSQSSFSSPYFDYIVRILKTNYTQEYCYSFCIQTQTIKYCNCSNVFLPAYKNVTEFCDTQSECMYDVVGKYGDSFITSCQAACPFECYSIEYSTTTFQSYYPTNYRQQELEDMYNYTVSSNNIPLAFLKVSIYYDKMLYTQIEQVITYTLSDLASNFGGAVGLCLGI